MYIGSLLNWPRKVWDIILIWLSQENYCLEMCTHVKQFFSYSWTNWVALSFYSHLKAECRKGCCHPHFTKPEVQTAVNSPNDLARCTKLAKPGGLWPGHSCMLPLGCSFLSRGACAQKRRIVHYGYCYHLCQRQLHSLPCRSSDLIHLPPWDHRAQKGLHPGLHAQRNLARNYIFLQQGWATALPPPCGLWSPLPVWPAV